MGQRGPKADERPKLTFHVEESVINALAKLQPQTGMTPDQSASFLLHVLVLDPANAIEKLKGLLGTHVPETAALLREERSIS